MRKTIEDLKIDKTFYKNEKNEDGTRNRTSYQAEAKRPLNLITGMTRFGHYFIDLILLYALNFGVVFLILTIDPYSTYLFSDLVAYALGYSIMVCYYFICEASMQRTIGKFATKSVVINKYGEPPSTSQLIGRSFARIIPFEAFSCLGDRGWHDSWSNTYVVSTDERDEIVRLLNEEDGGFISRSSETLD